MKKCCNCGATNSDEAKFCEECGSTTFTNVTQQECPHCHVLNDPESQFCESCGQSMTTVEQPASTIKSEMAEPKPESNLKPIEAHANQVESQQISEAKQGAEKTPKSKQTKIIAGIALFVLLGGGYFVYNASAKDRPKTKVSSSSKVVKPVKPKQSESKRETASSQVKQPAVKETAKLNFNREKVNSDLDQSITPLEGTNSVYVSPVDSEDVIVRSNHVQRSASAIKLYILVTAYAMDKEGLINLDDRHTVEADEKVGGTGVIRELPDGTSLTYREILNDMITKSDNTGANIMIDALGGFTIINNKIRAIGAQDTRLQRKMMDTAALADGIDNETSAQDMGETLKKLYNRELVSKKADDEMLSILANNQNHTKLPASLPSEAKVYNKTGEYGDYGVQNDAAIIANDKGAFVVVVLSQDGNEQQQVAAMSQLGSALYRDILG